MAALARAITFGLMPKVRVEVITLMLAGPGVKVNGFKGDADAAFLLKPTRYLTWAPLMPQSSFYQRDILRGHRVRLYSLTTALTGLFLSLFRA